MTVYATTVYGQLMIWENVRSWRVDGTHVHLWFNDGQLAAHRVPRQYVGFWGKR